MRAILVQPPFVQLNAPYPAIHYLEAFLEGRGVEAAVFDHSIALYRRIFSREGLSLLFAEAERRLLSGELRPAGGREEEELFRYLSYRPLYEAWIEGIVGFLAGGDPAFAHRLAAAAEFPRGARAEALLEAAGGRIGPEAAGRLATAILEDLGDFIAYAVDPDFGTVRYGERIARSRGDFGEIEAGLRAGFVLEALYRPFLRAWLAEELSSGAAPRFLLVSLPFPGCLLGALSLAEEAKRALGPDLRVIFGGGYVSTELRGLRDARLFDYCDYLVFDGGFGGLASILEAEGADVAAKDLAAGRSRPLYRTMRRSPEGLILAFGFPEGDLAASPRGSLAAGPESGFPERLPLPCPEAGRFAALEAEALARIQPDYRSLEPELYLRPLDSANPMHRLWSESPWLKYRLAQGCYWKNCAFCDTELDYVASYVPADLPPLLEASETAAGRTGLYGLHFVDEALPMARLLAFARANRERSAAGLRPFHFWGNARFDASWTEARCEYLAASGLVAVSGGIEVASERGLAMTDKGFDLAGLVKCLVGMRRAGLLVHGYLIYGFPGQEGADIAESAEIVRQLFVAGLLDSAFWHRFVLTRHSKMMAEWRAGRGPGLRPIDRGGAFAANDLEFEGEEAYEAYGPALDSALAAWMGGEALEEPFDFASWGLKRGRGLGRSRPAPLPAPGLVEALIARAEAELDAASLPLRGQAHWLAGLPRRGGGGSRGEGEGGKGNLVAWVYRGLREELSCAGPEEAERVRSALCALAARPEGRPIAELRGEEGLGPELCRGLLGRGLVAL